VTIWSQEKAKLGGGFGTGIGAVTIPTRPQDLGRGKKKRRRPGNKFKGREVVPAGWGGEKGKGGGHIGWKFFSEGGGRLDRETREGGLRL